MRRTALSADIGQRAAMERVALRRRAARTIAALALVVPTFGPPVLAPSTIALPTCALLAAATAAAKRGEAASADPAQEQGQGPARAQGRDAVQSPDAARSPAASGDETRGRASWAYDLAGELMSPFCPGRTLASCPSPQAGELIQWIATQEAAGVTRDEVVEMLVARYGEDILGAPPARGITLWAYVLPVAGFLVFGGIAVLVLRRIVAPRGSIRLARAATDGSHAAGSAASGSSGSAGASGPAGTSGSMGPRPTGTVAGDPGRGSADELARIVDAELERRA